MTIFGGFNWFDQILSDTFQLNVFYQGLVFFTAYSTLSLVTTLPLSYYSTFCIEEDFGFNKPQKLHLWVIFLSLFLFQQLSDFQYLV